MLEFPIGTGSGVILQIPILSAPGALDLTTVASTVPISVLRADETTTTWIGSMGPGVTATAGVILYSFVSTDLLVKGLWFATPRLTVPGGTDYGWPPLQFRVVDQWGRR